jgi:hypothetical protein
MHNRTFTQEPSMSLRTPNAVLGTFIRAGVLCVATGAGVTCLAHGLPQTPDTILWSPITPGTGTYSAAGLILQSWDGVALYFGNSGGAAVVNLRASVEWSAIS